MPKNYIVIHHSASSDHGTLKDFDSIKSWHVEHNGWRNIGYHWVVEKVNGILTAIPGRPEWDTGAHCPGRNQDGIGICCVGNFQEAVPSEELYRFVANLCREIKKRHPIQEIGGHRDYYATACPGSHFDVGKVRQLVKGGTILVDKGNKTPCKIVIKGKEFPGYVQGCTTYFDGAPVREVMEAMNCKVEWDSESMTAKIE